MTYKSSEEYSGDEPIKKFLACMDDYYTCLHSERATNGQCVDINARGIKQKNRKENPLLHELACL